jgi:hypothetical protein
MVVAAAGWLYEISPASVRHRGVRDRGDRPAVGQCFPAIAVAVPRPGPAVARLAVTWASQVSAVHSQATVPTPRFRRRDYGRQHRCTLHLRLHAGEETSDQEGRRRRRSGSDLPVVDP